MPSTKPEPETVAQHPSASPSPDPLLLFARSHQHLMDMLFGPHMPSVPGSAAQAQAQVDYGMDNTRGDGVNKGRPRRPANPQIMQQLFGR